LVWLAFDQLQKEGLIELGKGVSISLNNVSRRQMIKNVGLAAVVAFPLISSVAAPKAVSAQSVVICQGLPSDPEGCVCSSNVGNNGEPACEAGCKSAKIAYCESLGNFNDQTCSSSEIQCVPNFGFCAGLPPNQFQCCDFGLQGGAGNFNCV
jgi:hypothetical protein